jgi:hypothetical protein
VGGAAAVRMWDLALVVWALACAGLAVWTALEIHALTRMSDTLVLASRALDSTATGLARLSDVPIVGGEVSAVVGRLRETSRSALANAAHTRATIDLVAALVGVAIFVVAVVPASVAYLTVRPRLRRREDAA